MFQPEPVSAVITAVALVLTAIGGFAFRRGSKEGQKHDPVNEMRKVIEENTRVMLANNEQFTANNGLFAQILKIVIEMRDHSRETDRNTRDSLSVLRAILNEELRGGK